MKTDFLQKLWTVSPLVAVMAIGLWYQNTKFETYRVENNERVSKLENQLSDCNQGRIQDLKLLHSKEYKLSGIRLIAVLPKKRSLILKRNETN